MIPPMTLPAVTPITVSPPTGGDLKLPVVAVFFSLVCVVENGIVVEVVGHACEVSSVCVCVQSMTHNKQVIFYLIYS